MLLHDVVEKNSVENKIPTLDEINSKDPDGTTSITINLPNYQLKELLELSIVKYKNLNYVNGIISNATDDLIKKIRLQHQTTTLTFNGEEKIRSDVLLKIKAIAEYLETLPNFPILRIHKIKQSIDVVLGRVNYRTKDKYVGCIKTWLRNAKGQESYYNSDLDLSGLKQAVLNKMENPFSTTGYAQTETQKGA